MIYCCPSVSFISGFLAVWRAKRNASDYNFQSTFSNGFVACSYLVTSSIAWKGLRQSRNHQLLVALSNRKLPVRLGTPSGTLSRAYGEPALRTNDHILQGILAV